MRGAGTPASAGPACVPADLRANPRSIVAIPIPKGIARTPPCTNTPPTPRHVVHGLLATGDVRPPPRPSASMLFTAQMVPPSAAGTHRKLRAEQVESVSNGE